MDDCEIKKNFLDCIPEKILKITDKSRGASQKVKLIETDKGKYIIKLPKKKLYIKRQIFAYKKLNGKIPMAKIITYENKFLIENFIEGIDLDQIKLSKKSKVKIYTNLGKYLEKIHTVKTENFGGINKDNRGNFKSLRKAFFCYFLKYNEKMHPNNKIKSYSNKNLYLLIKKNLSYLTSHKLITKLDNNKIFTFLKKNDHFLDLKESFLLHFDYTDWNIKIKKNKIVAILDFANLFCGPKSLDFVRQYIFNFETDKFKYILMGYKKNIKLDEIKYFSVLHLTRKLPYYHYKNIHSLKTYHQIDSIKRYSYILCKIIAKN